jgi:hypothetical protein
MFLGGQGKEQGYRLIMKAYCNHQVRTQENPGCSW